MQRSQPEYEASLAQILRRAERRHHIYEGLDAPIRLNDKPKLETFRVEEMDWEVCLRRYFDHVTEWIPEPLQSTLSRASSFRSQGSGGSHRQLERRNSTASTGSYGAHDTEHFTRPVRRNSLSQRNSQYSQYGEARRSFPPQPHMQQHVHQVQQPHVPQPMAIAQGDPSNALVLYNSPDSRRSSMSMEVASARPVRRASITRDFHWEYVGLSTSWEMLAPLSARYPDLRDAQADIFAQTQGLSAMEARAYAQGRLANLPVEITNQVKHILTSMAPVVRHERTNSNASHISQTNHVGQSRPVSKRSNRSLERLATQDRERDSRLEKERLAKLEKERKTKLEKERERRREKETELNPVWERDSRLQRERELSKERSKERIRERSRERGRSNTRPAAPRRYHPRSISAGERSRSSSVESVRKGPQDRKQRPTPTGGHIPRHSMRKAPSPKRPRKPGPPRAGGLKVPQDLRPMTAISEKSHIIRSRGSSIDWQPGLPGSGTLKQLLSLKKSAVSDLEVAEPEGSKGNSLDSSSSAETTSSSPSGSTKSKGSSSTAATSTTGEKKSQYLRTANSKSSPSLRDDSMAKTDQPPLPNRGKALPPNPPAASKFKKSTLLALFRRTVGSEKQLDHLDLLSPPLSPAAVALSARHSRESLHRMSMEVLKRKDSKVTLYSVAEGMEVPFDTWLSALPYIEGRALSPRLPASGSMLSLPDLPE
jgi:hypothetical protein